MARLVTLQTFLDRGDALFLRSFLDAQGFFVFATDEAVTGQDWMRALAIGGVRIQVLDSELDDIHAVLTDAGLMQQSVDGEGTCDVRLPFRRRCGFLRRHCSMTLLVSTVVVLLGVSYFKSFVWPETDPSIWQLAGPIVLAWLTSILPMVLPLLRSRHPGFAEPDRDAAIEARDPSGGGSNGEAPWEAPVKTAEAPDSSHSFDLQSVLSRNLGLLLMLGIVVLIVAGPLWRLLSGAG